MHPEVSICVPAYNAASTVRATLDSILEQTFENYEVIVADNASTDGTGELAREVDDPRVRVVRFDELLTMGPNWSRTVGLASADLVKVVCADDLLRPRCLEVQVPMMADATVALAASAFDLIDDDGRLLDTGVGLVGLEPRMTSVQAMRAFVRQLPDELCPPGAVMFRRRDFERTTGFRDDFHYTLDIDVWFQIARFGQLCTTGESLAVNRASTINFSSTTSTLKKLREIARFNAWAFRTHHAEGGIRLSDLAYGNTRVLRALVNRGLVRAADSVSHRRKTE